MAVFNNTVIPLALVAYEMIFISLSYHIISSRPHGIIVNYQTSSFPSLEKKNVVGTLRHNVTYIKADNFVNDCSVTSRLTINETI